MEDGAKERVGELLRTPKGQSLTPEDYFAMLKEATDYGHPTPFGQWVEEVIPEVSCGMINWGKFEEVLKRKLAEQ